jgi:hypothetical protein
MGGPLCQNLLVPAFPQMVCIDSQRSKADQPMCGTLGQPACVDLDCVAPLVVHPSTKVCVPKEDNECGELGQAQCFWDGAQPCAEGLTADEGICAKVK